LAAGFFLVPFADFAAVFLAGTVLAACRVLFSICEVNHRGEPSGSQQKAGPRDIFSREKIPVTRYSSRNASAGEVRAIL
jgi:hypothetical protein